jgi:hypothetical protein
MQRNAIAPTGFRIVTDPDAHTQEKRREAQLFDRETVSDLVEHAICCAVNGGADRLGVKYLRDLNGTSSVAVEIAIDAWFVATHASLGRGHNGYHEWRPINTTVTTERAAEAMLDDVALEYGMEVYYE